MRLRTKSQVGIVASSAARDILLGLPRDLSRELDSELQSGRLARRWVIAQANARASASKEGDVDPLTEEDISIMSLLEMLDWQRKLTTKITLKYLEHVEGHRRYLEGNAHGIEETLNALEEYEMAKAPTENSGT
jgi:hypothetical protein